jgi:hypothetical protein
MTAFFEPADNGHSWRYLQRGWSKIAVHISAANGKNRLYKVPIALPPYILSGKHVRIELPKIKLHEKEIRKIRITGRLIRDYTLVDNPAGKAYAFKIRNGKFVTAENSGELKLVKEKNEISENEVFRLIKLGENHVAVKGPNGHFVSAESGGDGILVANRKIIDEWEIFAVKDLGNNQIALKTATGKYVTTKSGQVKASGQTIGAGETFTIVSVK